LNVGDVAILRYFRRRVPVAALPMRVASTDAPALWLAPGTEIRWPVIGDGFAEELSLDERYSSPWRAGHRMWEGEGVLIVGRPGRAHSLWVIRRDGALATWYVNLESPWQQTSMGWDTQDHDLDLVCKPDGSWRWKDEDDLEAAVRHGHFSAREAAKFRAEGERVLAEWPFPTSWDDWEPDPNWTIAAVPRGWRDV